MRNPFDFTGKKYIVTGASSGIGRAVSVRLAEQGAQVFMIARNEERLEETLREMEGKGHRIFCADLSSEYSLKELFDNAVSDGNKLDGMVYCAGIAKILPVSMMNKKTMDESMSTNLYSFAEMVSLLSKKKYRSANASIVGVSSVSSQYPQKCQGLYAATKAGMNAMAASLAIELADKGIRINTVMPATTDTEMTRRALEGKSESEIAHYINRQVLGMIKPEQIADVALFLLSDASSVITGRAIYADAGYLNF